MLRRITDTLMLQYKKRIQLEGVSPFDFIVNFSLRTLAMAYHSPGLTFVAVALIGGAIILYYGLQTLYLAAFPVKSRYGGAAYEAKIVGLFLKKHTVGLKGSELATYKKNVDVAKNIFVSLLQLPYSVVASGSAVYLFLQDPQVHPADVVITFSIVILAISQVRIYGSEKRIYDERVPVSPFARTSQDAADKTAEGKSPANDERPIYERIDRASLVASIGKADVKTLIERDKQQVEDRLSKSKFSKIFEISGQPPSKDEFD